MCADSFKRFVLRFCHPAIFLGTHAFRGPGFLITHSLCFLHQLPRGPSQPQETPHCRLPGAWGSLTPHGAPTVTCQVSSRLQNKAPSVRSLSPHRPTLSWVVWEQHPAVPWVPRTELCHMCLPYWTLMRKARAGTARCPCAGWRTGPAGRLYMNWRKSFCLKCLTLLKHFFLFLF